MEKEKGNGSLGTVKFSLSDVEGTPGTSNIDFTCVQWTRYINRDKFYQGLLMST